jgi:hypothetical protein
MSNPCGFTAASYQDLADILCTVQTNLSSQVSTLIGQVSALNNYVVDTSTGLPRVITDLDGLRDWVGDPSGGPTVYDQIGTAITDIGNVQSTSNSILANGASQNTSLAEINADVDEANDALGIQTGTKTTIIDAVQTSGVLSLIVGLADFVKVGGSSTTLDLVQWLLSLWNAPPLDLLTPHSPVALSVDTVLTPGDGVYGYVLNFTAPSYWGKRAGTPIEYIPYIARAAWRGNFGTVGDLVHIASNEVQVYPLPGGATNLQVHLEPSVTGTYSELRFL